MGPRQIRRVKHAAALTILAYSLAGLWCLADEATLQKQIDELLKGQEKILSELQEVRRSIQNRGTRAETSEAPQPARPALLPLNVYGEPFRGDANATVAVIAFSDFNCSHCAKFQSESFPLLNQQYIRPGKVRFYFRDLPSPADTNAFFKACAARCAGDQGKFWEMHDLLFATQAAKSAEEVSGLAKALGLDAGKFEDCAGTLRYAEAIRRSIRAAEKMGIFGTPAFLFGSMSEDKVFFRPSKLLVGGDSYEDIQREIETILAPTPEKKKGGE